MRLRDQTRRRSLAFRPEVERTEPRRLLSTLSEFPIPGGPDIGAKTGITAGPDGSVWFVSSTDDRVGRLDSKGQFTFVTLSKTDAADDPSAITLGPDGNLWFLRASEVGYVTPSGQVQEFPIAGPPLGAPNAIVAGSDGSIYFTGQNYLARVSMTGEITRFPFPAAQTSLGNVTRGLVVGPDGSLWFTRNDLTETPSTNQIGRMTLDGQFSFFDLTPGFDGVSGLTTGPDGRLWFTEGALAMVGAISMDGQVTEYSAPAGSLPRGLTSGPDEFLYVTLNGLNAIGQLSTDGQWTTVPLPSEASQPQAITLGQDGRLWFTEGNGSAIGSLDPTSLSTPVDSPPTEQAGTPASQGATRPGPQPPVPSTQTSLSPRWKLHALRTRQHRKREAWHARLQTHHRALMIRRERHFMLRMASLSAWHQQSR